MNKLSKWQMMNIVHGFLNCYNDDIRLNWCISIEETYNRLKDGQYGQCWFDGIYYNVPVANGKIYTWEER